MRARFGGNQDEAAGTKAKAKDKGVAKAGGGLESGEAASKASSKGGNKVAKGVSKAPE